jgi:hypothetical protein
MWGMIERFEIRLGVGPNDGTDRVEKAHTDALGPQRRGDADQNQCDQQHRKSDSQPPYH